MHRFIAIDEGLNTLLYVDERMPIRDWTVEIGRPQVRDMQLVGGNRVLVGCDSGYLEYDIQTGRLEKEYAGLRGVTSVRRQPGGHTLVAGVGLAGETGIVVLELDAQDRIAGRTVYPGDYVRLLRQTATGTYLMCCNTMIREADPRGGFIRDFPLEGFFHAWKALRLRNGNTLVSAGYGAFMVELDPAGAVVRRFAAKENMPAGINANFYAMYQLLPSGNIVVANWQAHGPGHGKEGVQLLELDPAGKIVWHWHQADRISSLQGVLVLDGLDTSLLHDEREGLMRAL